MSDEPASKKRVIKSSSNAIPKESNINEENSKKAFIIMELTNRWFCQEHSKTCFVDITRHIQLTPYHLTSWSNAIVSFKINFYYNLN
jgi:exonuclease III